MELTREQKIDYAVSNLKESLENLDASNIDKTSFEYLCIVYNLNLMLKMVGELHDARFKRK